MTNDLPDNTILFPMLVRHFMKHAKQHESMVTGDYSGIAMQCEGSFVEVDGGAGAVAYGWPVFFFEFWPVGQKGFVSSADLVNGVAHHLRSEHGELFPYVIVAHVVQLETVIAFVANSLRDNGVAGFCKGFLQIFQLAALILACQQLYGNRAFHREFLTLTKEKAKRPHFLPCLKAGVSMRKMR